VTIEIAMPMFAAFYQVPLWLDLLIVLAIAGVVYLVVRKKKAP